MVWAETRAKSVRDGRKEPMKRTRNTLFVMVVAAAFAVSTVGCGLNQMQMGGGGGIGGSEAKANQASGAPPELPRCAKPLGKLVVNQEGFKNVQTAFGCGSPLPAIRQFVQKSNCFTMLASGGAMALLEEEGGTRAVKADYALTLEPLYNEQNSGGAAIGAVIGSFIHPVVGAVAGSAQKKSAGVQVTLARKRDRQEFTATGDVSKWDFGGGAGIGGGSLHLFGGVGGGGYENTGANRMMIGAVYDAYYNLLIQLGVR